MIDPVFINAYQKYQLDLSVLLGADPRVVGAEMGAVFQFEKNLANVCALRKCNKFANIIMSININYLFFAKI